LLICLWPLVGGAAALDEAEQAIKVGRPSQAIATLENYHPTTAEETIRRLWALGVAYSLAGRSHSALVPLTQLVAMVPGNSKFRLELAGALILSGQSERARYHLEIAKGTGLPAPVQAQVQAEIDRLQQVNNWQGYFRFALVPESNAARRTAVETVNFGGLIFGIKPGARAQPANGVEIGFGIAALPRISDNWRAGFGLDAQLRLFDGRAPNDIFVRENAALLKYGDYGSQTALEIFASQRFLDNDAYSNSYGLSLSYSRNIGNRTRVSMSTDIENIDYVQGSYSVRRKAANLQVFYAASGQLILRGGARIEERDSPNNAAAGLSYGLSIGGDYSFAGGLRVGLDVSFDRNNYDGIHPLFGVARDDKKLATSIQFTNQNWSFRGFAPILKIGLEKQRSTIVLNRYRNLTASLGITRSF
jgi:hypothetical protein